MITQSLNAKICSTMEQPITILRPPYHAGLAQALDRNQIEALFKLLELPVEASQAELIGRAKPTIGEIPGIGRVVVKHYFRGGLLRHVVARHYLKLGKVRSCLEFNLLQKVRNLGIQAPEPVAYVSSGSPFYKAWLITKEINYERSLAEVSVDEAPEMADVMAEVARQIGLLIQNRIFHVDLHPGNILLGHQREVSLIDFDRARQFNGTSRELRDHYVCRWRRAVIKHGLPEVLSEMISHRLLALTPSDGTR